MSSRLRSIDRGFGICEVDLTLRLVWYNVQLLQYSETKNDKVQRFVQKVKHENSLMSNVYKHDIVAEQL